MQTNDEPMAAGLVILDYAAPAPSRFDVAIAVAVKLSRATWWFVARHRLRAPEVAIGGWLAWAALYVFWAARRFSMESDSLKPALALAWVLPAVVAAALLRLALRRRPKPLAAFAAVAALTMPAAGMVQYERCPHATWLQVLWVSVAVDGTGCGNARNVEPWWMRE